MRIQAFVMNELGTNTYVIGAPSGPAIVVDPSALDLTPVLDFVREQGFVVTAIVNTHCHFDHVLGNETAREVYRVPLLAHRAEWGPLRHAPESARAFLGIEMAGVRDPDGELCDGDTLAVANWTFHVLETPGHSPGGVCLYEPNAGLLISGDTLFAGTVGRTDLPGGDMDALMRSLATKLWPLPDETLVYPGHGKDTTIGEERMYNPFFRF